MKSATGKIDALGLTDEQLVGANIVRVAVSAPLQQIAENAGIILTTEGLVADKPENAAAPMGGGDGGMGGMDFSSTPTNARKGGSPNRLIWRQMLRRGPTSRTPSASRSRGRTEVVLRFEASPRVNLNGGSDGWGVGRAAIGVAACQARWCGGVREGFKRGQESAALPAHRPRQPLFARRREHRSLFVQPCEAQSAGALRQASNTCTVVCTVIFEVSSEVGHWCNLRKGTGRRGVQRCLLRLPSPATLRRLGWTFANWCAG